MKFLFSIIILFSSFNIYAADMAVQGFLGFTSGAANLGADIDFQNRESHSFGGYFVLGTEKDNVRNQFWSMGGDVKVFFGPDDWKVYIAPGVGVTSFDLTNGDTEITFGTIMKIGALLEVAPDMYVGLEQMYYNNWFSDKAPSGFLLTNAAFRMNF